MRFTLAILMLLTCCCEPVTCQDIVPTPQIILPTVPVTVEPDAPPKAVTTLKSDEWFIIESTVELIALQSPGGLVTIDCDSGPITLRGKFADGTGKIERRKYTSPFVYSITGVKTGAFELILIPVGVSLENQIVRQVLTVNNAQPNPPPDPEPGPGPEPTAKNVSVAIVEDTMNRSPETAMLMNELVAWTAFIDDGNDWRAYDLTTEETKGTQAITDLNGPAPGIVVYDKSNRKMIHRGNLPGTMAELKVLIGSMTGG